MFLGPIDFILIALVAYLIWAVVVSVGLISARRSPVATIGWLLTLLALPYVGALVYLFFGPRRLHRKPLPSSILNSHAKSRVTLPNVLLEKRERTQRR